MTSLPRLVHSFWICLCLAALSQPLRGDIQLFESQYLLFGVGRNFPTSYSLEKLRPSQPHPHIGFAHSLDQTWFLDVQTGFRFIEKRQSGQPGDPKVAIWSFSQDSLRIIRISHPLYLMTGPSLLYLLPTQKGFPPVQRDPDYPIEIGAGWSAWLVWNQKQILAAFKVERWRGTYSHRLHATQISFVVGHAI